ncbi:MAG: peroxiredoxin family protein [Planctomycetaceae bacterium]
MRRRLMVFPVAAAVIAILTGYKLMRTDLPANYEGSVSGSVALPAPRFELLDDKKPSELVRIESHLGRERLLVLFYDGDAGACNSSMLLQLRERFHELHRAGFVVFAVSSTIPQENRKAIEQCGTFPFPLLSDPDFSAHRAWGRIDGSGKPIPGLFLVDRAGRVAATPAGVPRPEWTGDLDPDTALKNVLHAN